MENRTYLIWLYMKEKNLRREKFFGGLPPTLKETNPLNRMKV